MSELSRRDALLIALTFAAGAVDAVAFLGLDVLTAVMTGNLVLLGVAIGRGAVRSAVRSLVALGGYAIGVVAGSRMTPMVRGAVWSADITRALAIEWALQAMFFVGWLLSGGAPDGVAAAALILISGLAMGLQAAAIRTLGPGTSTTYVTGTLTTLLGELSAVGGFGPDTRRRALTVVALVAGAMTGALVLVTVAPLAPAVPLVVIGGVVVIARRSFPSA
jgi:uncharacterized membrane protein YoaK (UPF0700 family)